MSEILYGWIPTVVNLEKDNEKNTEKNDDTEKEKASRSQRKSGGK